MPNTWKRACASVPVRFCAVVWVGCRIRAAWMASRKPAELSSCGGWLVGLSVGRGTAAYGVCGEEDEFVGEDGAPDYGCELRGVSWCEVEGMGGTNDPYASLRDCCGTWMLSAVYQDADARERTYPQILVQRLSVSLARVTPPPQQRLFLAVAPRRSSIRRNPSRRRHCTIHDNQEGC